MQGQAVRPIPIASLQPSQVEAGLLDLTSQHHLCGVAVPRSPALLLVRMRNVPSGTDYSHFLTGVALELVLILLSVLKMERQRLFMYPLDMLHSHR